ncbi:hypothetical protein ACFFON_02410 [Arthrobacter citreus]|uniref:hypothetical protein n=1 Tax=Arthrobacter TaxID=1663 RepID=UPI0012650719|nr:hypothetical protein [Arthrobacter gandavensis]
MNANADTHSGPEHVAAHPFAAAPQPDGPWLSTPSGVVALVALVLSVVLPPLFFPLAGLAFVLGVVALVRRRPRPRCAWVVTIISGVLLVVVLVIGILATLALFSMGESGSTSEPGLPNPAVTSVPASAPAGQP